VNRIAAFGVFTILAFAVVSAAIAGAPVRQQPSPTPINVDLDGKWHLSQVAKGISIPATVPGVVDADLLAAGKIKDPYTGTDLNSIHWVADVPWTYSRSFTVSPDVISLQHIILRCEGLDTLSHVVINDVQIAQTDNMFRTWEFDVKRYLHAGANTITITFDPVQPYLEAHVNQAAFPGKTVDVHGWGYIRKAPYQPGWDFAPDLVTCGIWRHIGLTAWNEARLTDVEVVQDHRTPGKVTLAVSVTGDQHSSITAHFVLSLVGRTVAHAVSPMSGGVSNATMIVTKPKLWWPAGMGAQTLYTLDVTLTDQRGHIVDTAERHIGLRTITSLQKTDTHPLTLCVNGVPFFAKGTNWVPCDAIMTRTTPAELRAYVDNAVAANMNLMRLWGGGFYEDNALFDECDKKGLLLWSEFKFADAAYPAFDPAWLANVKAEVNDNVRRLRLHPCIAVWSGNNEVIGFVRDKTSSGAMSKEDYDLLFHQMIPDTIHAIAPNALYTPGSPESGDQHDWSVWHGDSGFESYRTVHGFMSEFGFQAFPQPKSVEDFTAPADRKTVESPVMEFHQHNWRDGNALILNTAKRYYRQPKDFPSALWLSQIQQADGILMGVESWRRDWPNSTGSLVWQYDDPWPAITWSMVDYYGRPKALYYRIKHAYAPVMLSGLADNDTGNADLWVANDRRRNLTGRLDWKLLQVNGITLGRGSMEVVIPRGTSSTHIFRLASLPAVTKNGPENLLMAAELHVPGEPVSKTLLLFVKPKFLNLMAPNIESAVKKVDARFIVTLTAKRPALDAWIDLAGIDTKFSDNFVNLMPGEPDLITVAPTRPATLAQIRRALQVKSLFDTYLPGGNPEPVVTPNPDGSIVATAEQSEVIGDNVAGQEFSNPADIGNWQDINDSVHWWVKGVSPGTYNVVIDLSCPPGEEGSAFSVTVGNQSVNGVVPATAGWTDYRKVRLGTITLNVPGEIQILVKPLTKPSVHVMNIRSITLLPVTK
jgi:beta-mannosidase